jgi:hypothetical protein
MKKLTGSQYNFKIVLKIETKDTDVEIEDAIETLNLRESDYSGILENLDEFVINRSWEKNPNTQYS